MARFLPADTPFIGLQGRRLVGFWAWAYSDILANTIRPLIAEYLVGEALGCLDAPRREWDQADFTYRGKLLEVKSAGYVQTWVQERPSTISFAIRTPTKPWDAATNTFGVGGVRPAALYVFALHSVQDRESANPLDTSQWEFYAISTQDLGRVFGSQKSMRLMRLRTAVAPVPYRCLKTAVDGVVDQLDSPLGSAAATDVLVEPTATEGEHTGSRSETLTGTFGHRGAARERAGRSAG